MVKILSGDIQIIDKMVPLKTPAEMAQLDPDTRKKYDRLETMIDKVLADQNVTRGQKARLDFKQFEEFTQATAGLFTKREPGGSSANTLTTLRKLLGDKVDVTMLGVAGRTDEHSILIRKALADSNIKLIPENYPLKPGQDPESATSFVFQAANGKRTILTYPGNAHEILNNDMVTPDIIANNDVLFVQGSLWEKFDESFANKLMELRWQQDAKEIWLALPTHAKFRDNMPPKRYRELIPSADVVLGNHEELMRIYETKGDFDKATALLQDALAARDDVLKREGKSPHPKKAVAFITRGELGAAVVTADDITYVPPSDVSKIPKTFELGAGDTSYAGFLAGHLAGLNPKASASLGMQIAGTKLQFDSARIPNPREALPEFSVMGKQLMREVDRKLAGPDTAIHKSLRA